MKFLSITLSLLLLVSFSVQEEEEDIYVGCRGDMEIGPAICNKFNFLSSEEVVGNNETIYTIRYTYLFVSRWLKKDVLLQLMEPHFMT